MTVLKKDYEAVFKEGFKLGNRLARAKINIMRASDAKRLGDDVMSSHYEEYAKTWSDICLLYTSPSPRDQVVSRMPSSA